MHTSETKMKDGYQADTVLTEMDTARAELEKIETAADRLGSSFMVMEILLRRVVNGNNRGDTIKKVKNQMVFLEKDILTMTSDINDTFNIIVEFSELLERLDA